MYVLCFFVGRALSLHTIIMPQIQTKQLFQKAATSLSSRKKPLTNISTRPENEMWSKNLHHRPIEWMPKKVRLFSFLISFFTVISTRKQNTGTADESNCTSSKLFHGKRIQCFDNAYCVQDSSARTI